MQMKTFLRPMALVVMGLAVIGATLWAALAPWYTLGTTNGFRYALGFGLLALGAGGLLFALIHRRLVVPLAPFVISFAAVLIWWSTIEPRDDRDWQPDVAILPSADINGNSVTLRNIRNFKYRSETDFTLRWWTCLRAS